MESVERMELADSLTASDRSCTPPRLGWFSPRISFSHDFAMLGGILPEDPKSDYAFDDDFCTEFEFSMSNASLNVYPPSPMLSAEELFVNGTLRPFHLLSRTGSDENLVSRNSVADMAVMHAARHLGFQNSPCSSMRFDNVSDSIRGRSSVSLGNSSCSSPSRSFSFPLSTPAMPKACKQSTRFRYFFNLGKLHAPTSKDIPQYNTSFSLKLPLSPRSFWPFFRSKSAGEVKINTETPVVTRRSGSASENKSSMSCSLPSKHRVDDDDDDKRIRPTSTAICSSLTLSIKKKKIPSVHAPPPHLEVNSKVDSNSASTACSSVSAANRGNAMQALSSQAEACCLSGVSPSLPRATALDEVLASLQSTEESHMTSQKNSTIDAERTVSKDSEKGAASTSRSTTTTSKACGGFPGIVHERVWSNSEWKVSCSCSGEWIHAASRGNTSKFVLRNLERCSASFSSRSMVRSQDWRSRKVSGRSEKATANSSYSASVRVTPVLNVPAGPPVMTAGKKASKSSLFNLTSLFSKKGKQPPQQISASATPTITSWRDGRVGNSSSSSTTTVS